MKKLYVLIVACAFAVACAANATPIQFTFNGVINVGTLDAVNLAGSAFTVSGNVTDETDLYAPSCCGVFSTEQVLWDFGSGNTFLPDDGGMLFSQQDTGTVVQNTIQVNDGELYVSNILYGNTASGGLYTDSNVPEAIGAVTFVLSTIQGGFVTSNSLGQTLNLQSATLTTLVTTPIPIPPALWLFGSGLLGLIGVSRRKKAA